MLYLLKFLYILLKILDFYHLKIFKNNIYIIIMIIDKVKYIINKDQLHKEDIIQNWVPLLKKINNNMYRDNKTNLIYKILKKQSINDNSVLIHFKIIKRLQYE
jgi:hypothetical protein